jgi:hypothetical protein
VQIFFGGGATMPAEGSRSAATPGAARPWLAVFSARLGLGVGAALTLTTGLPKGKITGPNPLVFSISLAAAARERDRCRRLECDQPVINRVFCIAKRLDLGIYQRAILLSLARMATRWQRKHTGRRLETR